MNRTLKSPSRRSFLKSSSLAAVAAATGASDATAQPTGLEQAGIQEPIRSSPLTDPVSLVNLLQGTNSTPGFSRGNTLPIAARPFGMAHWTLQSNAETSWIFHPGDRRIQGLRCTHQLSPWLSDYGHATFLPFCGEIDPRSAGRASSYRPEEAALAPHSLRLHLARYGVDVELIPTERCALITANFGKPEVVGLLFDIPGGSLPDIQRDAVSHTIMFTSTANSGGIPNGFASYYILRFAKAWKHFEVKRLNNHTVGLVRFDAEVKSLEVRIATSFISFEQAQRNLDNELNAHSSDALRQQGKEVWNKHLLRIKVEGGSLAQRKTFYSCLYRTLLFPRIWHEPDAAGAMQHRSPYTGVVSEGVMYADHGYWDVYRAWYPLMTILFPERLGEILQAWVNGYKEGGWLPQFPSPGYRACMTGSLIDSVFGDAAAKGIEGFDMATAYEGLKKHATQPGNPDAGYGRRGIEDYLRYNYCPADRVAQSAAETLDAAYGDFCIAQVAKALGNQADYAMFMQRSENWRQLFDPQTGFLRGKNADGAWLEPFNPITWGDPYVEGSAWQHRWDVPHNFAALMESLGGTARTVAALEGMLTMPPDFNVGVYGQEIHEMSEMAAVPFGQYSQSNQPVHHVLYLFAAAGRPDRTRYWTQKVLQELYSTENFPGDEDTGSMAAWFIFSSLGFYPTCPGKPEYVLGSSFFPRAIVDLANGKTLTIDRATSITAEEDSVTFNGKRLTQSTISHATILAGGHLRFT
jgi:predicted alpha-1,2-mannosidase